MSLGKILHADSAGPSVQKLYHQSHYVLAGLVPATLVSDKSSIFAKVSDVGLAAAIPLHSHIAMNYGKCSLSTSLATLWYDQFVDIRLTKKCTMNCSGERLRAKRGPTSGASRCCWSLCNHVYGFVEDRADWPRDWWCVLEFFFAI